MLHVGAVVVVPRHLGELGRRQLAGNGGEGHQAQVIPGVLAGDQRVQGHGHLLGRKEVVPHRHRQGKVEHQHRARSDLLLGPLDLEVLGGQPNRRAAAGAADGVADGSLDVEVERITELVGLGGVGPLVPDPGDIDVVLAQLVGGQPFEQLPQCLLAQPAQPAGRQFEPAFGVVDQALLLQHPGQLGDPLQTVGRFVAQQPAYLVHVGLGQGLG